MFIIHQKNVPSQNHFIFHFGFFFADGLWAAIYCLCMYTCICIYIHACVCVCVGCKQNEAKMVHSLLLHWWDKHAQQFIFFGIVYKHKPKHKHSAHTACGMQHICVPQKQLVTGIAATQIKNCKKKKRQRSTARQIMRQVRSCGSKRRI